MFDFHFNIWKRKSGKEIYIYIYIYKRLKWFVKRSV